MRRSDEGAWENEPAYVVPTILRPPITISPRPADGPDPQTLRDLLYPCSPSNTPPTHEGGGPFSLKVTCTSIIAMHIDLYLEALGAEALAWLPVECKALLLTICRRRRTLHDPILLALSDPDLTVLDLWGCGTMISDRGVRKAICNMPNLLALDITGCINVSTLTLRKIAHACPRLQLLRLGLPKLEEAALEVLPDILPRVMQHSGDLGDDGWESLIDSPSGRREGTGGGEGGGACIGGGMNHHVAECGNLPLPAAASAFGRGRLSDLRWLVWPNAPREVERLVAAQCPKVKVNPMPASLREAVMRAKQFPQLPQRATAAERATARVVVDGGGVSLEGSLRGPAATGGGLEGATAASRGALDPPQWDPLDPMCALDEPLAAQAPPSAWEGLRSGVASATPSAAETSSIAERFRQAFIERDQRLRDREVRMAELVRRRQLRASPALRAMDGWLDEE